MITCAKCLKQKPIRSFRTNSRNYMNLKEVCETCRTATDADREAWKQTAAKASTVSKLEGTYVPPTWHTREGSDAFTKIRSLGT